MKYFELLDIVTGQLEECSFQTPALELAVNDGSGLYGARGQYWYGGMANAAVSGNGLYFGLQHRTRGTST